ncbi:hypothetical protein [Xanthomonas sacchari]|uniref:Uncharacterized protein n=1 Tax=Xanthomonas sacchari TaxID=56458 RepID=A0AA46SVI3_9XANT|nr:hypothetical protein [Xanthomonas sacchari]UYK89304.1 hypothetical protein NG824_02260 [Xanthomonas sacchari]
MNIFRSSSNCTGLAILLMGCMTGCDGGSAKSAKISVVSDYAAGSDGLTTEVGPEFFDNPKTIYLDDNGKRIDALWFGVSGGEMRVMGKDASGAHGPVSEEKLRDGVCKGIAAGGQGDYVRFYSVCVSEVPVSSGVNSQGGSIAARTPYFQIATKDGANTSILRVRFSVEQ